MGFVKTFNPETGYTVDYWHIAKYSIDIAAKVAEVTIYGYLNQDARKSGKKPALVNRREVSLEGMDLNGNIRAQLYTAIKALKHKNREGQTTDDFFKDSTDEI